MIDSNQASFAEELYVQGMQYNWRQGKSQANAALARALFERAAAMEHHKSIRALSEMLFVGAGGSKDQEHALWLKWAACLRGDSDALDELSVLLGSYAESITDPGDKQRAENAARKAEEADERLKYLGSYLHDLIRSKLSSGSGE